MPTSRTGKVTLTSVNSLRAGEALRDTEIKGFGVRRRADQITYFLQRRVSGRLRWITIGTHGSPWTPASARHEALRLLHDIADGGDPTAVKRTRRATPTLAEVVDLFLAEHGPRLKPSTLKQYRRIIDHTLLPALGRRLIDDVARGDIVKLHAARAGTPREANFTLSVLSKIMSWAEDAEIRPAGTNPCRRVKRFSERKRQRYLSNTEIERLGATLDELEETGAESSYAIAAVRLLLLTGCRLSEILTLQWHHVDAQRSLLMLPDSKTGEKVVYLNDEAKAVLLAIPRQARTPYVIAGATTGTHLGNLHAPWYRMRARAELPDVRLHDLRHSFASLCAERGASLLLIGKLLGHASPLTTQRYAHLVADPVKELNQKVGSAIARKLKMRRVVNS